MNFFMKMNPPTCTAQMKKVAVINGRPIFYDTPAIKNAKKLLCAELLKNKPSSPIEGPVALTVVWFFPKGKSHKNGEWRITRPDTDNLEKLLKDCMTKCGFWKDDAQVVIELCMKMWSDEPYGIYVEVTSMGETDV